jgi:quercetin dioxygenase-like cupin family protein
MGAQRLAGPVHSHDHYEETIYGIDGVLTWTVDGKQIDVGPGQALCIPRGAITGSITTESKTRRRFA